MQDLKHHVLELIRLTSTSLPSGVETLLKDARTNEAEDSAARKALETILENITIAKETSTPLCQDTGTPIFFIKHPRIFSTRTLACIIREAVAEATKRLYLRPNAVDSANERNSGNNLGGSHFPSLYFEEVENEDLTIDLLLKGGGCENVGCQYSLPDARLRAGRDLDGVRRVALDAVFQAQGRGCSPGFLGIAIGGDRGTSYLASKEAFLEKPGCNHPDPLFAELEKRITKESNTLGIGPMGFGGRSTILGTRVKSLHRLPASYFVSVSYMCWAYRHHQLVIADGKVSFN